MWLTLRSAVKQAAVAHRSALQETHCTEVRGQRSEVRGEETQAVSGSAQTNIYSHHLTFKKCFFLLLLLFILGRQNCAHWAVAHQVELCGRLTAGQYSPSTALFNKPTVWRRTLRPQESRPAAAASLRSRHVERRLTGRRQRQTAEWEYVRFKTQNRKHEDVTSSVVAARMML